MDEILQKNEQKTVPVAENQMLASAMKEGAVLPRSSKQHGDCHATKEELREDGLKVMDDCPICQRRGVLCEVGAHPSAPSAVPATAGGLSGDESSAHESSDSDNTATICALALGKAIPIFQRGNKDDKAFAKTVTKRIQHMHYSSKVRAIEVLNDVDRSADSRKRKRERFEEIENENELKNG